MITLDFDLLMEDCYKISSELYTTIKAYLDCGVTLYMDMFGRVYLGDVQSIYNYVGTIEISD